MVKVLSNSSIEQQLPSYLDSIYSVITSTDGQSGKWTIGKEVDI